MRKARDRKLRVIQWGTGNAGRRALAGILRHPDLELAGVHAHAQAKVGRDAAELCGWPTPTGVRATNDAAALLALDADCVCYMARGETRIRETIDDLCRILAAGKDVVNTALVSLCYPDASPKLRDRLAAACAEGESTFFTSGFDPGWSGDVIPLQLAACCERVESVRVSELMDYSTYPDPAFTGVYFGFGRPLDYPAPLLQPGMIKGGWGCMVLLVADALGVRLDEIREEALRLQDRGEGLAELHLRDRAAGRGWRPQHRRHNGDCDARRERDPSGVRCRAGRRVHPRSTAVQCAGAVARLEVRAARAPAVARLRRRPER
jgi:4-hydroxy-tetrahydrodipicolinate reductase